MTDPNEVAKYVGIAANTVATAWIGYTVWLERRERRLADEKAADRAAILEAEREKRAADMAAREAQWKEDERIHKRHMEELALATVRQAGAAAKEAKKAAEAAKVGRQEVMEAVDASKQERRGQFDEIKELASKALEVNTTALNVSNGVNAKIASYGKTLTEMAEAKALPAEPV